jgi:hypothetical protein
MEYGMWMAKNRRNRAWSMAWIRLVKTGLGHGVWDGDGKEQQE